MCQKAGGFESSLAISKACKGTEVMQLRCTAIQSSPDYTKSKWILEGRYVQYFRLHEQFVIESQLCPNSRLLNPVAPTDNCITSYGNQRHEGALLFFFSINTV